MPRHCKDWYWLSDRSDDEDDVVLSVCCCLPVPVTVGRNGARVTLFSAIVQVIPADLERVVILQGLHNGLVKGHLLLCFHAVEAAKKHKKYGKTKPEVSHL